MNTNPTEGGLQITPPTPRRNPAVGTPPKKLRRSGGGRSIQLQTPHSHLAPRGEENRETWGPAS